VDADLEKSKDLTLEQLGIHHCGVYAFQPTRREQKLT
jgi:hypothetical protein